ncbi:MAG: hypothetical protein EOP05_14825, partial [Proteobacteria bacterium]
MRTASAFKKTSFSILALSCFACLALGQTPTPTENPLEEDTTAEETAEIAPAKMGDSKIGDDAKYSSKPIDVLN